MEIGTVATAILGVLTLVSVVTSAVAVARSTLSKTTIATLTDNNAALTARVDILEAENGRHTSEAAQHGVILAALRVENKALQTYVSGTDAVKALADLMTKADQSRAVEHHDILDAVRTVPMLLAAHHEEVMALIKAGVHTHHGEAPHV